MELQPKTPEQTAKNKKVNKVILAVFLPLIALFVIIGAMGSGGDTPNDATGANPTASNKPAASAGNPANKKAVESPDEKFARLVTPDLPVGVEPRHAKNNADVVCQRLDLGHDPKKVREGVRELRGTRAGDSIFEAAITVYCPKHKEVLTR